MRMAVNILDIQQITHEVKCFRIEKPSGYKFLPGQATDVSINKPGIENELRPFTFTALPEAPYLEFTIKRYPDHHGITDKLHQLVVADQLLIGDAWGAIGYKGPGYFIAGGAGITPFISILRYLHSKQLALHNRLFFSNKTEGDIIYKNELQNILGNDAIFTLTRQQKEGYENTHLDEAFLEKHITDFSKHIYVCGPDKMISEISGTLQRLGASADTLVFEK